MTTDETPRRQQPRRFLKNDQGQKGGPKVRRYINTTDVSGSNFIETLLKSSHVASRRDAGRLPAPSFHLHSVTCLSVSFLILLSSPFRKLEHSPAPTSRHFSPSRPCREYQQGFCHLPVSVHTPHLNLELRMQRSQVLCSLLSFWASIPPPRYLFHMLYFKDYSF